MISRLFDIILDNLENDPMAFLGFMLVVFIISTIGIGLFWAASIATVESFQNMKPSTVTIHLQDGEIKKLEYQNISKYQYLNLPPVSATNEQH